MIRSLYARLYRMSVEQPLRFLKLAALVLGLIVIGVCGLIIGIDELVRALAH